MRINPGHRENISVGEGQAKHVVILSSREKRLLRRLAEGKSDSRIHMEIGGTVEQIGAQRRRLIERLRIGSQAELVTVAEQLAPYPKRPI